ncbi:MAG TPA: alkaline phosphatase family protein, partial [Acidimicrobiales bacterium]|nr:alkaline phosphatase family protein [Acidimicrobiales bacterium]
MFKRRPTRRAGWAGLCVAAALGLALAVPSAASAGPASSTQLAAQQPATQTPVKHLVVIFQENVSFDHYFGTYPQAANPPGEPPFEARPGTPTVNGLSGELLTANPNLSNPQRLDRSQALTCDQDHDYTAEQAAADQGVMDKFVQATGGNLTLAQCLAAVGNNNPPGGPQPNFAVMDYFDGNTVTALWNYAQHFAMSDNSYGTSYGPSSPGAVNVTSGNTFGAVCGPSGAVLNSSPCSTPGDNPPSSGTPGSPAPPGSGTMFSDADPLFDVCSNGAKTGGTYSPAKDIEMGGQNVGDLLDQAGVTWGWFEGGFASPGYVPGQPSTDDLG